MSGANDEKKKKTGGLAGIIAGDSTICVCDADDETLRYRGYSIEDLALHSTFEEVCWLLLRGELPTRAELDDYCGKLKYQRDLPGAMKRALELIPGDANMMDVLRTGCSLLGHFEPETSRSEPYAIADRLIACLGSIALYWYQFHRRGMGPDLNTGEPTLAGHILHLLMEKTPSEDVRRALDVSLILYAEHDFNASTFTARVITSTMADFYSAVTGAIGALSGPLHGGANEKALQLIQGFDNADSAEKGVLEMLQKKELIMGFGHRVYTTRDPRSAIVQGWAKKLADARSDQRLLPIAERIEQVMWHEKKLFPNADFYHAPAYQLMEIPMLMFTPIFVFSRISGWSAHILEQRANNKLIRPISNYTGESARPYVSIEER